MRGTKAKALRTADRPHPGRVGGGRVKNTGRKGERRKWVDRKTARNNEKAAAADLKKFFNRFRRKIDRGDSED